MKVRCIDNINASGNKCHLTINKIYNTIRDDDTYCVIISDINEESSFFKYRFIDIIKERKEKLEKLNAK